MKRSALLLYISYIFSTAPLWGEQVQQQPGSKKNLYFCTQNLDDIPILQGGRVKPLYVHAKKTLKFLIGKARYQQMNATTVYCLLSLQGLGLATNIEIKAPIEHEKLKKLFNLKGAHPSISFNTLKLKESILRQEYQLQKKENSYKKALAKTLSKLRLYEDISTGMNWTLSKEKESTGKLVPSATTKSNWHSIASFFRPQEVMSQAPNERSDYLYKKILESRDQYAKKDQTFLLELKYSKMPLVGIALFLTLLALGAKVLFKNEKITLGISALSFIVQTLYITLRVLISGRAPITNMYETVMFSGYGAFIISLIVGHLKKEMIFVTVGLAYNVLTLMMLIFAQGMLNPHISPLVPVLRDNIWLSTHVTCIILSYGALALSWALANNVILKKAFFYMDKKEENYFSQLIYTCLKVGTVLLAAGIILGGVWADYSWGRFWGWDPKETWSLIVLCIYMAILHGRYTSWIPTTRFIPLVAAAFMSVMMAWFGVNYILASGLHSYGFSQGGAVFLGSFFLIQTIILMASFFLKKRS